MMYIENRGMVYDITYIVCIPFAFFLLVSNIKKINPRCPIDATFSTTGTAQCTASAIATMHVLIHHNVSNEL